MEVVKMNSLKSFKTLNKCIALLMVVVMLAGLNGTAALAEEAHEHTYEPANDYKKEPTCTEYGFTPYVCSGCGDIKYEDISEPLGHDWDEGKVVVEPSAQTQGATGVAYTCTRCGEVRAEWVLPKTEGNTADGQTQTNEQQPLNEPTKPPVADKTADLEGAPIWERVLYYVELTGDWATDLISIANTQLGYKESSDNFEAEWNENTKSYDIHNYTRYGAWCGHPYGEWCAMFVSFCLHYAGIPEDAFPQDIEVRSWIEKLSESGQYEPRSYTPKAGDLAFFDMDLNGKPDHVGIVFAVEVDANVFATVEGNHTEEVGTFPYTLDDEHIVGYGVLPKNPDPDPKPHPALSADTATQQQAGTAENPESTSAPAENNAAETPATETNVPTVTEGTSDYGSFVADSPVPEGTVLHAESAEPSVAVSNLIRNYVAKPMDADPDEITVLTYTIWLATPQGGIADTGANVTVKTMLPLPVLDNSTGTPVLAQVKDCAVVYSSQDGTLHFYNAEVKIENGAVTGISFRAPEAAVYAICFVLK